MKHYLKAIKKKYFNTSSALYKKLNAKTQITRC